MKTKYLRYIFLLVAVIGAVGILFYKGVLRMNYPSFDEYPVRGIDISHHQGDINWPELNNESIEFIFIKSTEGGDFVDPRFEQNWENAQKNGYKVGAYHFYRLCKTGYQQANNVKNVVPKSSKNLPIVLDLEYSGNCRTEKSKDQIIQEIENCIDELENHYGKKPILYVMKDFYTDYVENNFMDNRIWIRDIMSKPTLNDNREWTFWQYSNCGRISGIEGCVDLNVFKGTSKELVNLK